MEKDHAGSRPSDCRRKINWCQNDVLSEGSANIYTLKGHLVDTTCGQVPILWETGTCSVPKLISC